MREIAIKQALGKLNVAGPLAATVIKHVSDNAITILPIGLGDALSVADLPHHHRDPFDRLLVAQCLAHDLPIISADAVLDEYGVRRIW